MWCSSSKEKSAAAAAAIGSLEAGDAGRTSFEEVSLVYVRFLRLIGLLPFDGRQLHFFGTRALLVYFVLASLANSSMFACFCLNSREVHVDAIAESVITMGVAVRFHLLIGKRRQLHDLVRESAGLWSSCEERGRLAVLQLERRLRKLLRLFVLSGCFINVLYPANALVNRLPPTLASNHTEPRRMLPYRWYGDDMEDHWPGYWPTFLLQMLIVQSAIVIGCTCDATPPFLMVLGAGYFQQLRDRIQQLDGLQLHHGDGRLQLVRFTVFHQRLLRHCARLEKFLRTMLLIQLLSTGYNISLVLFKLASPDRDKNKYLSLLGVCVCQLFLCQWSPDFLFDQSLDVSSAAYFAYSTDCCWTTTTTTTKPRQQIGKHLLAMIARAQRPVQITAGGFIHLSLQNFGSMLTSAFSFFTVLRNFNL